MNTDYSNLSLRHPINSVNKNSTPDSLYNLCIKNIWALFNMQLRVKENNANVQLSLHEMEWHIINKIVPRVKKATLCETIQANINYLKIDDENFKSVLAFLDTESLKLSSYVPGIIKNNVQLCSLLTEGLPVASDAFMALAKINQQTFSMQQHMLWKQEIKLLARNVIFKEGENWEALLFQTDLFKNQNIFVFLCQTVNEIFKVRFSFSSILALFNHSFDDASISLLLNIAMLDITIEQRLICIEGVIKAFKMRKEALMIVKMLNLFKGEDEHGYTLLSKLFFNNRIGYALKYPDIFHAVLKILPKARKRQQIMPFDIADIYNILAVDKKSRALDDATIALMVQQITIPTIENIRKFIDFAMEEKRGNEILIAFFTLAYVFEARSGDFINLGTFQQLLKVEDNDVIIIEFLKISRNLTHISPCKCLMEAIDVNASDKVLKIICNYYEELDRSTLQSHKLKLEDYNRVLLQKRSSEIIKLVFKVFEFRVVDTQILMDTFQLVLENNLDDQFIIEFFSFIRWNITKKVTADLINDLIQNAILHQRNDELIKDLRAGFSKDS